MSHSSPDAGPGTPPWTDYWSDSRLPWVSLLFVLPFLILYEAGVLIPSLSGGDRNGADLWIRETLLSAGCSRSWLFPLLVPVILLGWQIFRRDPWTFRYQTLAGMLAESLLFALLLVGTGQLLHATVAVHLAVTAGTASSFLGAGIYEELLYRLILLPLLYGAFCCVQAPRQGALIGSVLISSVLFAAAHYVSTPGLLSPAELFNATTQVVQTRGEWYGFLFRALAGSVFATLFWVRGFGIAAGTHLLYDLIVGGLLS